MLAGLNPTGGLRTAQLDRQGNLLVAHSALSMGADAAGRCHGTLRHPPRRAIHQYLLIYPRRKRHGYPHPEPQSACQVRNTLYNGHRHAVRRLFSGEYRR